MATTTAEPASVEDVESLTSRQTPLDRVQRVLHDHPALSPFIVLIVSSIVFDIINGRFLHAQNISLMLQQVAVIGALGVAETLIILTAGIDLSVGAAMILAQLYMAQLAVEHHLSGVVALALGLLVGVITGAINGGLVSRLRIPPFITTLGTFGILTSWGLLYSNGQTTQVLALPSLIGWTGNTLKLGSFNLIWGVVVMIAMYLITSYMLNQTRWGRHVYAVGDDPEAARLAGIRTKYVLFSVYVLAGLMVGLAAWISIGYTGAASPNNAVNANLQAITAVVIGGTSLFGGRGGVIGTLWGALIVVVFTTGLTLANVNDLYQPIAEGILVIAAVGLDQWIRKDKA